MVDNGASPQEAFRDAFAHFLGVPTATVALGVESDKGESSPTPPPLESSRRHFPPRCVQWHCVGKPPFKVVAAVTAFSEADHLGAPPRCRRSPHISPSPGSQMHSRLHRPVLHHPFLTTTTSSPSLSTALLAHSHLTSHTQRRSAGLLWTWP